MISIIDTLYDTYLRTSGRGDVYLVPVTNSEDGISQEIRVWATSETEAQERAIKKAVTIHRNHRRSISDRTFGTYLGADNYKPKSTLSAISAPIKVWHDPVYSKLKPSVTNPANVPSGSFIKASANALTSGNSSHDEGRISKSKLVKAVNINVLSLFCWLSLIVIGMAAGYTAIFKDEQLAFILKVGNYATLITAVIVGPLGIYSSCRNIRELNSQLERIDEGER